MIQNGKGVPKGTPLKLLLFVFLYPDYDKHNRSGNQKNRGRDKGYLLKPPEFFNRFWQCHFCKIFPFKQPSDQSIH